MDLSFSLLFLYAVASSYLVSAYAWPSSSLCPLESEIFRRGVQSQCPRSMHPNPPLEVDGTYLDRVMDSDNRKGYTAVLFYASWCPFSQNVHPKFDILSTMFPQIEHLALERSGALPSVFSRYGIHSLPTMVMVNQTTIMRYRGPKDMPSLIRFYERTTGLRPLKYVPEKVPVNLVRKEQSIMQLHSTSFIKEMVKVEPYLAFSVLFLCLRILILVFPRVLLRLKAFWVQYIPQPNLGIFGETSQLFGRTLQMIDVRSVWTRLRLCKIRSFHERARNAQVWASSLASVALGESSSARSSS